MSIMFVMNKRDMHFSDCHYLNMELSIFVLHFRVRTHKKRKPRKDDDN